MKKIHLTLVFMALLGLGFSSCNSDNNQMEKAYEQTPEMTGDPETDPAEEDTSRTDGAL